MKNTQFKAKKSKFVDSRGVNIKKNYSSFWMDDQWDRDIKFGGMTMLGQKSNNIVKLVKLSNYRRAIANFVKIVAKKDIPVLWAGSNSYTDGESITISTDIKENNFDVAVGLALHEASHILLSDFKLLKGLGDGSNKLFNDFVTLHASTSTFTQSHWTIETWRQIAKNLLNWIEDRRIDSFVFSTSPGYKAYYHKLYDYYWNSEDIHKGFSSEEFLDPTKVDNWFFHIINSLNPQFDPKALPRLDEIVRLIDVRNISRVQNTGEAFELTMQVLDIIYSQAELAEEGRSKQNKDQGENGNSNGGDGSSSSNSVSDINKDSQTSSSSNSVSDINKDGQTNNSSSEDEEKDQKTSLTPQEIDAIKEALVKQKNFLNGRVGKKTATNKLQRDLEAVSKQTIELQAVGGEDGVASTTCLVYDLINSGIINTHMDLRKRLDEIQNQKHGMNYSNPLRAQLDTQHRDIADQLKELGLSDVLIADRGDDAYGSESFKKGLDMGGLLGKKLQLHNESRERVDNRLRSGKIDNKRLASAGYGIESVFKQIHTDKYKKANLHISLDGSGSMAGSKWKSVARMTAAICKAANYTQNINVQVSIRVTVNDTPAIVSVYDSRKNNLNHLSYIFSTFAPCTMTPEGLCFEAMAKKKMFIPSSSELDSYFLNLSDGEPNCDGYHGPRATQHTKKWVNKIKSMYNISVLSFWLEGGKDDGDDSDTAAQLQRYQNLLASFESKTGARDFREMYGVDASVVDPSSAMMIAKTLNKKFLTQ